MYHFSNYYHQWSSSARHASATYRFSWRALHIITVDNGMHDIQTLSSCHKKTKFGSPYEICIYGSQIVTESSVGYPRFRFISFIQQWCSIILANFSQKIPVKWDYWVIQLSHTIAMNQCLDLVSEWEWKHPDLIGVLYMHAYNGRLRMQVFSGLNFQLSQTPTWTQRLGLLR